MNIFIDGFEVPVTRSRESSLWYVHPKTLSPCMRVQKVLAIGYQTKYSKISRCNEIVKQFLAELATDQIHIQISYCDAGFVRRCNDRLIKFTFTCCEHDIKWSEQRLQDLLDRIKEIKL